MKIKFPGSAAGPDAPETAPSDPDSLVKLMQVILTSRSDESLLHCKRVKCYTRLLCRAYNSRNPRDRISRKRMDLISIGAQLHDIGKICIPYEILHKNQPLTEEEEQTVRNHTKTGAELIDYVSKIIDADAPVLHNIVLYHHERWNGQGYPEKLSGDRIPLEAQLVSIAEVYDTLTAEDHGGRCSHETALKMIMGGECGMFNPEILECLKLAETDFRIVLEEQMNIKRVDLLERAAARDRKRYWRLKRALDIAASALGIVILSPFLAFVAVWIKIDDPKSQVIFRQTRVGRHRKEFTMYKFRTMVPNAETQLKELQKENEKDGPVFKIRHDPRITKPGSFLRKTSLDELPQLFNVLRGDMTVVGPRPPLPSEVAQYSKYHEMRLSVTPGLTCLWQSHDDRDDIPFEEWMDMDLAYIGTRSVAADLKIIMKTIGVVLKGSGN